MNKCVRLRKNSCAIVIKFIKHNKQLNLLAADLAKTDLIRQYQEQEAVLQQEIQQCKHEVERVRKGQVSVIAQTS